MQIDRNTGNPLLARARRDSEIALTASIYARRDASRWLYNRAAMSDIELST
jgi:hypothetical protein